MFDMFGLVSFSDSLMAPASIVAQRTGFFFRFFFSFVGLTGMTDEAASPSTKFDEEFSTLGDFEV